MRPWARIARAALAVSGVSAACSCGVPDVTFLGSVDASEASSMSIDSGVEAGTEGGVEAGDGAASGTDGASVGCPSSPPVGAATCCGAIPCEGTCRPSDCTQCSACSSSQVCCVHGQGVTCNAPGTCK